MVLLLTEDKTIDGEISEVIEDSQISHRRVNYAIDSRQAQPASSPQNDDQLSDQVEQFLKNQLPFSVQAGLSLALIGDDEHGLEALETGLRSCGHSVIGRSHTALEAVLSELGDQEPDTIIFDIGLSVAHHMRTIQVLRSVCPSSKILILSPDNVLLHIKQAQWCGAHGYMQKGASIQQIVDTVINGLNEFEEALAEA